MIDHTYTTSLSHGNTLVIQLDKYLVLLEAELCHEMLPTPLQSVALKGLVTITGLDILGWHKMQQEIFVIINTENCENLATIKAYVAEWKEYFIKLLKFIEIIPEESLHFFDDEVKEDVRPLCEWGNNLINELIQWMQSVQDLDYDTVKIQDSTDIMSDIAITQENIESLLD